MGWNTPDLYNQPEHFGLTVVDEIDGPDESYSYNMAVLWKHADGRFFYAQDSGCSCPSPFEMVEKLDDADLVRDWAHLKELLEDWSPYCPESMNNLVAASRHDMLVKASAAGLA